MVFFINTLPLLKCQAVLKHVFIFKVLESDVMDELILQRCMDRLCTTVKLMKKEIQIFLKMMCHGDNSFCLKGVFPNDYKIMLARLDGLTD